MDVIESPRTYEHKPHSGGPAKQIVILLHGLGSDGRDLIGLAPYLAPAVPDAVFVSPDAPFPCDMAPMGYQWFSMQDWTPDSIGQGVERVAPVLDSFMTEQLEKYGLSSENLVLGGFSQGAMMSLYAGLRWPQTIAGILAYSGVLIDEDFIREGKAQKPPVHLYHGTADQIVPFSAYHHAKETLESAGVEVSGGFSEGLAHGIDGPGIESGAAFLRDILT